MDTGAQPTSAGFPRCARFSSPHPSQHLRCQAPLKGRCAPGPTPALCSLASPSQAPFGLPRAGRRGGLDGVDAKAISRVLQGQQRLLIGLMVILHGETGTRRAASSAYRRQLEREAPRLAKGRRSSSAKSWQKAAGGAKERGWSLGWAGPAWRESRPWNAAWFPKGGWVGGARSRGQGFNADGASAEGTRSPCALPRFPQPGGHLRHKLLPERETNRLFSGWRTFQAPLALGWGGVFLNPRGHKTLTNVFIQSAASKDDFGDQILAILIRCPGVLISLKHGAFTLVLETKPKEEIGQPFVWNALISCLRKGLD